MGMVVIGGLLISATYWGLQRTVVPRVKAGQPKKKKQKMKLGMGDSFKVLASKQYIRDLAALVSLHSFDFLGICLFHPNINNGNAPPVLPGFCPARVPYTSSIPQDLIPSFLIRRVKCLCFTILICCPAFASPSAPLALAASQAPQHVQHQPLAMINHQHWPSRYLVKVQHLQICICHLQHPEGMADDLQHHEICI